MEINEKLPEAVQDRLEEKQLLHTYRKMALQTLAELLGSSDDRVRLQAAQTLLDLYKEDGTPLKKLKELIK